MRVFVSEMWMYRVSCAAVLSGASAGESSSTSTSAGRGYGSSTPLDETRALLKLSVGGVVALRFFWLNWSEAAWTCGVSRIVCPDSFNTRLSYADIRITL